MKCFDVIAVNFETGTVRLIANDKDERNAEAICSMAVLRRGVNDDLFVAVAAGSYADGDKWRGFPMTHKQLLLAILDDVQALLNGNLLCDRVFEKVQRDYLLDAQLKLRELLLNE